MQLLRFAANGFKFDHVQNFACPFIASNATPHFR